MPDAEEKIRAIAPGWKWPGPGPVTDWIDMVFKLPDSVQRDLTLVRLQTNAALHQALAQGFSRAAEIVGKSVGQ